MHAQGWCHPSGGVPRLPRRPGSPSKLGTVQTYLQNPGRLPARISGMQPPSDRDSLCGQYYLAEAGLCVILRAFPVRPGRD